MWKTQGRPTFGFVPMGFATSGSIIADLIKCGLISYNTAPVNGIMYDKVGKATRDAVQGRTLVGNGASHITMQTSIIPETDYFDVTIEVLFGDIVTREG